MTEPTKIEIKTGGFYRSQKTGAVIRCLRFGDAITSFCIAETPQVIQGPSDNIFVMIEDNDMVEITENEYIRQVLAFRLWHDERFVKKNAEAKIEDFVAKFKDMDLPSASTLFTDTGGFKEYQLADEKDVVHELEAQSGKFSDEGAPAVFGIEGQKSSFTSVQNYLAISLTALEEAQEKYWCPETRNAIIDITNAISWLDQRMNRIMNGTVGEEVEVEDTETTDVAPDNVLPMRQ